MKKIGLHEIRREFLDYFEEKGHLVVPSFSLIPKNDKSLLLIGAGMAPMKKYFTGELNPPRRRMATCQKCIRTGDIENVGKTDRHATFFEMLGNFSFGDYFKKEAIEWAWEFLTERLEIEPKALWASVYFEDTEAARIWNEDIGLPMEKIVPLGKEDNFWELEIGPSGPCSEIYIDRGEAYGCGSKDCKPGCECDRFIEVWNLVFTQFDKDEKGVYHPLAHPNIDTGMGLERIAAVMENANNIFEIKEIKKIINKIEDVSDYKYGSDKAKDVSIRVITDHIRAMTFLVGDGVLPSNEGRGYVLRRLIRRASRHGKLLRIDGTFLTDIVGEFINSWMVEYKEIKLREDHIKKIIKAEEDKFQETIDSGMQILEVYIKDMEINKETMLSGERVFKLYDTYGFPLDLTLEILEEKSLKADEREFNIQMENQRKRARTARDEGDSGWGASIDLELFKKLNSIFKGYETTKTKSKVISLVSKEKGVNSMSEGEEGMLVLDETPFYAESGGQVGDSGLIKNDSFEVEVIDTKHNKDGLIIHMIKVMEGTINLNDEVVAMVDISRRDSIRRNHSATHLLHKALREVLGEHVNQAGSIVLPNRLRFDYTHFESPTVEQLNLIEQIVNREIYNGLEVTTTEASLEEAQKQGVVGLFEEKYGEIVRIIRMGDFSQELCGGTHVINTSNIGMFKIISEGGIASGVRRIEAITGLSVYEYLNEKEEQIETLSEILKTNKIDLIDKTENLVSELKAQEKEVSELKKKLSGDLSKEVLETLVKVGDTSLVTYRVDNMDIDDLRTLGDKIKDKLDSGVIVLASVVDEKIIFLVMVTKDLNSKGILAGNIVKEVAKITGGNGGGRPNIAQAGGRDVSKLEEAFSKVVDLISDFK
ncbi:alanine--tRNA ligase [Tissierella creatinophila]|uniref:Alanine--tRNA ligase n=1 Tax=Tissierella creatinophila DSM 6911 TaxID=1123403 RepID=A0A1U7M9A0_TISCR|nr:alanine--tRNA ligase [Tissierella creatinophila]OLS03903.1 alanine--tRNA ligase [Tissierella creatinophila DSM 6911]